MPYGKKARTVRAYDYGCLLPLGGEGDAIDEMRRRVRFWNALVELHEAYRQERQALIAELRALHGLGEKDRLKLTDDEKARFRDIDQREHADVLGTKAGAGLWWCNADDVVVDFHNAVRRVKGHALRFHAWRLSIGKVMARWQTGLPVAAVLDPGVVDSRMQLRPLKAGCLAMHLRVGGDRSEPAYLTIPVVLHRPLPPDGLIRQVSVHRERVGPHDGGNPYLWKAVFIVETPEEQPVPAGRGRLSLDLGWRRIGEELRVGYWRDDAGNTGEVRLPERVINGLRKCEDLRSIRDQHFNVARASLQAWLAEAERAPDWLKEGTAHIAQWRSPERLTGLVWRWKDQRFTGDTDIYGRLEVWRKRERHLWAWEANSRDQLLRRRLHLYREFAAWVAKTYQDVVIEDFDLRAIADLEKQGKQLPAPARHNRVLAAPSELRLALKNACTREGVKIAQVGSQNTTRACHNCGSIEHWDAGAELRHRCSACGVEWDQDDNAASNLLSLATAAAF